MVKRVIINLDSSKVSGPDCILIVVLKNCEPRLSYILAETLNMCREESGCPNCWKVSSVAPVFKECWGNLLKNALLPEIPALLILYLWLVKSLKNRK